MPARTASLEQGVSSPSTSHDHLSDIHWDFEFHGRPFRRALSTSGDPAPLIRIVRHFCVR
ncbi:hypothetical protein GLOTRDRAFT_100775 [Gloeophyllum trabeum ATCC 11539]|uniref:Uncharacterized protein n=1 Tax=Gloeophyllum trabeum (strain ATCC 11539 / FP-39264 / Madison 617) TaxID=670483 RepID=S7RFP8_GLOTA|nr:uncharacterized protein GLOTRDRAFT_100775 [Gloeophyllum trabeum ATCC 11539]EPQ52995.1 hypothetical protein GLOTRDRAFT_100775 [Gloeophyllum trabeum ATCC 11539]